MIFGILKTKLIAAGAVLVAVLLAFLKFFMARSKSATKRADRAEAGLQMQSDIQEADTELSKDLSSRKAKIKQEISEGKPVKSLEEPNEDWK